MDEREKPFCSQTLTAAGIASMNRAPFEAEDSLDPDERLAGNGRLDPPERSRSRAGEFLRSLGGFETRND